MALSTMTEGMVKALTDPMIRQLNECMREAAEPIIQEALKKIEKEMRAELAYRLISTIEQNMAISRNGTDVVVTIRQAKENAR